MAKITKSAMEQKAYEAWLSMRKRCNSKSHKDYCDYGARGIRICPEWDDFDKFVEDVGLPESGMSLGRIDNDLGYEKSNVRWETQTQQQRNKRINIYLTYNGTTKTQSEWAEIVGVSQTCIRLRLKAGWSVEKTLITPSQRKQNSRGE